MFGDFGGWVVLSPREFPADRWRVLARPARFTETAAGRPPCGLPLGGGHTEGSPEGFRYRFERSGDAATAAVACRATEDPAHLPETSRVCRTTRSSRPARSPWASLFWREVLIWAHCRRHVVWERDPGPGLPLPREPSILRGQVVPGRCGRSAGLAESLQAQLAPSEPVGQACGSPSLSVSSPVPHRTTARFTSRRNAVIATACAGADRLAITVVVGTVVVGGAGAG